MTFCSMYHENTHHKIIKVLGKKINSLKKETDMF